MNARNLSETTRNPQWVLSHANRTAAAKKCVAVLVALALALGMVPLPHTTAATAYADDASPLVAAQPETPFTPAAATGEGITLPGNYESNGVVIDDVAFHVLYFDESQHRALLLAKDVQKDALFDEKGSNSWKDSDAREWLNNDWLRGKNNLSANVLKTTITTRNNYSDPNPTFIPTEDNVFLLSEPDVYGYDETRFKNVSVPLESRDFTVTDENGRGVRLIAKDGPRVASKDGQLRQWWMRSPVYTKSEVSYVCKIGRDLISDANFTDSERGFRPALWVKLAAISTDANPGSIDISPKSVIVGPGDIVKFNHVVKGSDGQPMPQSQQDVTWKVSGGKSWYDNRWIDPYNRIDINGRLELDGWAADGSVVTVTATSTTNPDIQASATVAVSVSDWPVKTISKTGSDLNNMVILFLADGFKRDEQDEFLKACNNMWQAMISTEPYRSFASRINVYAMCTDSIQSGLTGEQSFFRTAVGTTTARNADLPSWVNHVPGKILGPAFAEKYMDKDAQASDINSYVIVGNSPISGGASHVSRGIAGFHYVCMTNGYDYPTTFRHEMGHNLLGLGDEYNENGGALEKDNSPNMSRLGTSEDVNWRKMLGYANTGIYPMGKLFLSSSHCAMNDMTPPFCSVCELQGARTMATDIDDQSFYVFKPQLTFGEEYVNPDKFSKDNYYSFINYRAYHKIDNNNFGSLTSSDASNIIGLKGKTMSFRTIIQNFSPTKKRTVKVSFEIKHKDGTSTNVKGEQEFTVDEWADKELRHQGRMTYLGGDYNYKDGFNSGLANCDLKVQVPADANVRAGDKVVFSISEVNANNTETPLLNQEQSAAQYANATIHYLGTDGKQLPDTVDAVIPVRVGDPISWTPPARVGNYKYVEGSQDPAGEVKMREGGVDLYYTYAIDDTPKPDPTPSQTDISSAEVSGLHAVTYDGNEHKLVPTVKLGANTLSPTDDYTVSYSNDLINAGTVKVTIEGKGNYQGTISKSYEIQRAPIDVPQGYTNLVYTGFAQTGVPSGHYTLTGETTGTNASTTYTAYATPTSNHRWNTGNPTDMRTIRWSIAQKPLTGATIALEYQSTDVTGAALKPAVTSVRVGNLNVSSDNYDVSYSNNTEPGTGATVILHGKKNFSGTESTTFTIKGTLSTDNATVEPLADVNYSDQMTSFINPVVKLKQGTTPLTKGVDFTLEFDNLPTKDPGAGNKVQVSATLRGAGKYLDNTVPDNKLLKVSFTVVGQTNPADPSHDTHTYTGKPIRPGVNLSDANGTPLKEGKDYIIAYSNNVRPGTARMTIVGIGLYCGTIERTFKIVRPARNATPSTVQSVASEAASARSTIDTVALATAAQMTFRPDTLYKIA